MTTKPVETRARSRFAAGCRFGKRVRSIFRTCAGGTTQMEEYHVNADHRRAANAVLVLEVPKTLPPVCAQRERLCTE